MASDSKSDGTPGHPKGIKPADIVLKRAIEPLTEKITEWLNNCFNFQDTGWIDTCTVIISLLDENSKITARWVGLRVIPVKWQMAGRVEPTIEVGGLPVNDHADLEHEADVMGAKANSY